MKEDCRHTSISTHRSVTMNCRRKKAPSRIVNARECRQLSWLQTGLYPRTVFMFRAQVHCAGTKTWIAADCEPWRRTAKKKRSSSGEKKLVRAPFTVGMRANSL